MSAPQGKWLIYLALPSDSVPDHSISPSTLLRPYLDAVLSLCADPSNVAISPLFTVFYFENLDIPSPFRPETSRSGQTYLVPSPLTFAPISDLADLGATIAERTFMEAIKALRSLGKLDDPEEEVVFWPPLPTDEQDDPDW